MTSKTNTRSYSVPIIALSLLCLASLSALSHATPINYGDFDGTTVVYRDVTEDANSVGDTPPLFGAPTISGDSLEFSPVGFSASATGAGGVDQTDGNLFFMIEAKPLNGISTVLLREAGDTGLGGFGTDATYTEVKTFIHVDILTTDLGPVNINRDLEMTFSPSGGDFGLATDGGGGPSFSSNWIGSHLIDVGAILAAEGHLGETATKVNINMDNILLALSEDGTTATISKKDLDTSAITIEVNIPEPTTGILALISLVALTCCSRRQS